MSLTPKLALNKEELSDYMFEIFPQIGEDYVIDELDTESVVMRLRVESRHLRPGGTVSGPSMFALADVTVYAMVLARLGRKALAVTTNSSLDFLRKPDGGVDIIARGKLLKMGRVLVVGDVLMYPDGSDKPVARATMTYSIPPDRSQAN